MKQNAKLYSLALLVSFMIPFITTSRNVSSICKQRVVKSDGDLLKRLYIELYF